jgi:hypothetical protein
MLCEMALWNWIITANNCKQILLLCPTGFFSSSMNYYISIPFYNLWDTCHKHLPVLSSFMTYHRVCNKINTTGATSGAGTAYPSGAPEFISVFSGVVRVNRSLVLCVCFVDRCLSFCTFSLCHCVVCSSIYRFWLSDIFKLFLSE